MAPSIANTILLRLEGMQSWGVEAPGDHRGTLLWPTRSGILGIFACALGLQTDRSLLALDARISLAMRCDRPGHVVRDYHTVGAGYGRPVHLTASGTAKTLSNGDPYTIVTQRDYLADASFLIAVQLAHGDPDWDAVLFALRNPIWPFYLGRACCPPCAPVLEGTGSFPSPADALPAWPAASSLFPDETPHGILRVPAHAGDPEAIRVMDRWRMPSLRRFYPSFYREVSLCT